MTSPVQLYVYDLSNGLAKQLSLQLTGRQIDGIWHTSVVVFGKEIFYGQGIGITAPGRSHHGTPLQVIDIGETAIDEDTFDEYLQEMKQHYTADKYHLLDFNCNSFTNDVIGFLTGGAIPEHIKDLPSDFLSTPFGAALRPTIDNMYRRPVPGAPAAPAPAPSADLASNPALAASVLQAVAAQAAGGQGPSAQAGHPLHATETLTAPLHPCTNPASFHNLLRTHRAVVADFTDQQCGPCRMIAPVFERLAEEKGVRAGMSGRGAAFTSIDIRVGQGNALAAEYGIRATPTFLFFLDGKKISEVKGADAAAIRSEVDLLLYQAYPPHPHTKLDAPAVQALSLNPILFTQVPALDTVFNKLSSNIKATPWPADAPASLDQATQALGTMLAYLKQRYPAADAPSATGKPAAQPAALGAWTSATHALASALPAEALFPLADLWRLAVLDPAAGAWCASGIASGASNPITILLRAYHRDTSARSLVLTVLRLLANSFAHATLARTLLSGAARTELTGVLVPALLHDHAGVRTAAASVAFNAAAALQKARVESVRLGGGGYADGEDEDWEIEMVSAVIEALDKERASEDVVHRLTACLAFLLRLSPFYEDQVLPMLEVLQAKSILLGKLEKGGCGEDGIAKKDVRSLVEEVAGKLCPA
ncbi:PPPDE putative peptidase domain-containing protein [Schizophyllum amplum]|uniref:PPPDE putative peptidase domain-containing protein n=1 Tax=Schizophyllum amplum TaxID=97359 RepID=A0A550CH87_9AGAR|nr:PPPDE putative peptidase domain-containing protein [Auriculariopsis ampla]